MFKIIEKSNPLAVHCICDTFEQAHYWLTVFAPLYVSRGYFSNKSLTADSFMIAGA